MSVFPSEKWEFFAGGGPDDDGLFAGLRPLAWAHAKMTFRRALRLGHTCIAGLGATFGAWISRGRMKTEN